jgi:hypothetical protein
LYQLLLLQLAWLYALSLWVTAHADELGRGLVAAILRQLVLVALGGVAAMLLLGYVIAAICLRKKPRTSG